MYKRVFDYFHLHLISIFLLLLSSSNLLSHPLHYSKFINLFHIQYNIITIQYTLRFKFMLKKHHRGGMRTGGNWIFKNGFVFHSFQLIQLKWSKNWRSIVEQFFRLFEDKILHIYWGNAWLNTNEGLKRLFFQSIETFCLKNLLF